MRRPLAIALVTVVLAGFRLNQSAVAASALPIASIDDFDTSASWFVASGSASVTTVSSPKSSGSGSLRISYDVSSGTQVQIALTKTLPDLPGLPRRVALDVNGDGSWNVIYLQLRDATGEIFHYRLGNASFTGWQTLSVEPGKAAPATTIGGNHDGILDLPVQPYRIVVDKNPGGTKTISSLNLDHLVVEYEPWSALRTDAEVLVPSAGQSTIVRLGLVEAGSFSVIATDEGARTWTWSGSASGGGLESTTPWSGQTTGGIAMTGSVRATLEVIRSGLSWRYGIPYFARLGARYESPSPGSIAGVNSTMTEINTGSRAAAENQAALMEAAFVRKARESFDWNRVEPRKGWYDWATFDQAVEIARAHQVSVVGTLEYSAKWASSAPAGTAASSVAYYPPANAADFAAYARAVVHRYKDRVHVWEIWNEENSSVFWKPSPDATRYAALLEASYAAIKAEDPSATVLLGGTVGFDQNFMDAIYSAGAWSSYDALAIHTYVAPRPEQSMVVTWLANARAYLDAKGTKPLWITEFGWSTYTGSGSSYIGVSESKQAEYLAQTYILAAKAGVAGILWYNLVELSTSATTKNDNYGVVEQGGRLKPAYAALRRISEALDGGTSAGDADPNAGSRSTVAALDATTGWTVSPLGGGTASIVASPTHHGGSGSMKLTYGFTATSTGVELRRNLALLANPSSLSVWVFGDGSANPVYMKIADATGETFQAAIGSLGKGWQRMTLHMDGGDPNWTHAGGDGDGVIDGPITLRSLFVYRAGIGRLSGTAYFDDVQVETGPRVRGVVISRRGGTSEGLYSLGSVTVSVPVSGTAAWIVDGPSSTSVPVSSGRVSVTVGPLPVNVLTAPGLSSGALMTTEIGGAFHALPGARALAGSVPSTNLSWVSGDQTHYSFQVVNSAGVVVRTVTTNQYVDAGIRSVSWDGRVSGVPATPGPYQVRLAIVGPDSRTSYLTKTVTVP